MAKEFRTIEEALQYLEASIVLNLEKIGEEIKSVLRQHVWVLWYNRPYTPTHYTRTLELIDCLTVTKAKKIAGGYEVMIYFDTDKINPYPPANPGEWTRHQSITDGQDVSEFIPLWIEEGQNSPLFSYSGVHPVQETIDWEKEDQYVFTRMKELLGRQGFKCL